MPRRGPRPTLSTTARGYGADHRRRRAADRQLVDAGLAYCQQPVCLYRSRWIPPGSAWDEGHNDQRTDWIGPCHRRCNQIAGASKGGKVVHARQRRQRAWQSQAW